ncbi:hypothetical protein DF186_14725 [Enterococcus hirae]|nr:hypothetical protein DF186_14725 [Enterococcus hirae]
MNLNNVSNRLYICVNLKALLIFLVVVGDLIFVVYECVYKIDLILVFGGIIVFNCELYEVIV